MARINDKTQLEQLFHVLFKYSSYVQTAMYEPLRVGDPAADTAITQLVRVNALMPYDDQSYSLNPHLRNLIQELYNQYGASQTITRISGLIDDIKLQYKNVVALENNGNIDDALKVADTMDWSVNAIIHHSNKNISLLFEQISSNYGDVSSLNAKLLQNIFYEEQVRLILMEMIQLKLMCKELDHVGTGVQFRVAQAIVNRIIVRQLNWDQRLMEIKSKLSKLRFEINKLSKQESNLAKVAQFFMQNPTQSGLDMEFERGVPAHLLHPQKISVRSSINLESLDDHGGFDLILFRLPGAKNMFEMPPVKHDPLLNRVLATEMEVVEDQVSPIEQSLNELISAILDNAKQEYSLLEWQRHIRVQEGVDDECWIYFCATQLRGHRVALRFDPVKSDSTVINDWFTDIYAIAKDKVPA